MWYNYILHIGVMLEIYILLAFSMNLLFGYTGLMSMSQAAFYGLGAYTTALLMTKVHWSFGASVFMAMLVSIGFAFFLSFLANRLRDLYFGLATLAIQIIFYALTYNWIGLTNGPYGVSGIPPPSVFGYKMDSVPSFFLFGLVIVLLSVVFFRGFEKTQLCRMMKSVRDDQLAVVALGKNPNYYKLVSLSIAGIFSAIAGALYATYVTYIDPSSFTLDESILILSIVLIGGTGSFWGSVVGAVFYVLLPEVLKLVYLPDSMAANVRMIIFGLLLIVVVRLRPNGFLGKYQIR